jgi:hypothetical protein
LPWAFTDLRFLTTRSTAGAGATGEGLPIGLMDVMDVMYETDMPISTGARRRGPTG